MPDDGAAESSSTMTTLGFPRGRKMCQIKIRKLMKSLQDYYPITKMLGVGLGKTFGQIYIYIYKTSIYETKLTFLK